jgi:acyl-coenzyme A thioesterase PaaI-like protein
MKLNRHLARFLMNLYPPMLVNRIRIKSVSSDYKKVEVKLRKSIWNRNLQGSIFGGSIFSAADPFIALMYWQALHHNGISCEAWLKSASIRYKRPASTNLFITYQLSNEDVISVTEDVIKHGKAERTHTFDMRNIYGEVCVEIETTVVLRLQTKKAGD